MTSDGRCLTSSSPSMSSNGRDRDAKGGSAGSLITGGERIESEDCIVAATVLLSDEPVVTRNIDHYERVDGLEVRTY